METIQQIVPISDLKLHHAQVLGRLAKGPVVLAQRSRPKAVLVSIEEWNQRAEELAHYRHLAMLDEQFKLVMNGNYQTQEQIEQGLRERGSID
jgi:prevent-host-death family protein